MDYPWYNQTAARPRWVQASELYVNNIALEILGEPALTPAGWWSRTGMSQS